MLKAVILSDNIADGDLLSEWGFCVQISYRGKSFLLDTGSSDNYLANAGKLGIDIADVDFAALSHAHYDHSTGYRSFFAKNSRASLFMSSECGTDCYFKLGPIRKYAGIPKYLPVDHAERITPVSGLCEISEGVWLVPHIENGIEEISKKAHLYRRRGKKLLPDDFSHELSLVFDTDKGLVLFNSCSHGGLKNIVADIEHYLPGKSICMTVGGLHFKSSPEKEIRAVARMIKGLDIERVVTGHCTGDKGFRVLKEELGDRVVQTRVGMTIEV